MVRLFIYGFAAYELENVTDGWTKVTATAEGTAKLGYIEIRNLNLGDFYVLVDNISISRR